MVLGCFHSPLSSRYFCSLSHVSAALLVLKVWGAFILSLVPGIVNRACQFPDCSFLQLPKFSRVILCPLCAHIITQNNGKLRLDKPLLSRTIATKNPAISTITGFHARRVRDSNPWYGVAVQRFSRPSLSAAQTTLLVATFLSPADVSSA